MRGLMNFLFPEGGCTRSIRSHSSLRSPVTILISCGLVQVQVPRANWSTYIHTYIRPGRRTSVERFCIVDTGVQDT